MDGSTPGAPFTPTLRTPDDDGRITLVLTKPIVFGSDTITQLRFRPTKAKDLRDMPVDHATVGHLIDIAGKLCGQPPAVMDELEGLDLMEVVALTRTF